MHRSACCERLCVFIIVAWAADSQRPYNQSIGRLDSDRFIGSLGRRQHLDAASSVFYWLGGGALFSHLP